MSYIGTPPARRILSSADIAQGAVTLDDINFTDVPINMDITGTIDKHTMRLADGVTITGDVTISEDLVLAKLSDDGDAITMTNDGSSRTITGSGSIEASTLAATPQYESLTGMTGVLDSTVTGGSGLTSIGTATDGTSLTSLGTVTTGTLGSGVIKKVHGFSSYLSGTDCNIPNASWEEFTGIGTWTERFDSHGHYDTSTGRFTPTVQGVYLCGYSIFFGKLDEYEVITAHIRKNSSMSPGYWFASGEDLSPVSSNKTIHFSGSGLIQLDTDDYVSGWCRHTEGATENLQNEYTEFWAVYIGTV